MMVVFKEPGTEEFDKKDIPTCFTKEAFWLVRKVNRVLCFESFRSLKALPHREQILMLFNSMYFSSRRKNSLSQLKYLNGQCFRLVIRGEKYHRGVF